MKETILTKNQNRIKEWLNNGEECAFYFDWTISKGYETYGYNICTCKVSDRKVGQCSGGGYDMQGTAIAEFFNVQYGAELYDLFFNKGCQLYGYAKYDNKGALSGSCGLSSILDIVKALGFSVKASYIGKNNTIYNIKKL